MKEGEFKTPDAAAAAAGGDGGGIGIERLLNDRCEADLAVGGAGGGTNDDDDDDDGARQWAEAQRAMYG